jgi:hypothetical protein
LKGTIYGILRSFTKSTETNINRSTRRLSTQSTLPFDNEKQRQEPSRNKSTKPKTSKRNHRDKTISRKKLKKITTMNLVRLSLTSTTRRPHPTTPSSSMIPIIWKWTGRTLTKPGGISTVHRITLRNICLVQNGGDFFPSFLVYLR